MNMITRRDFLRDGIIAATTLLTLKSAAGANPDSGSRPFEMLVVGDSHMSGQGLVEKNKFYYIVKEWIRTEVLEGIRDVRLKVRAHSGARLELHLEEEHRMLKAGDDIFKSHHPEANLSQPSIRAQIDAARREYADPKLVDLILLSGGITDVLVANTINPFFSESELKRLIGQYCRDGMAKLLKHTAAVFPNAQIVVVGYFPIVSTESDVNQISRYLFKAVKFPHPLQFAFTNGASKQFMKVLRKKMAVRSRLWVQESNLALSTAVRTANEHYGRPRAVFIESPITEQRAFGTSNAMLWGSDENNLPSDERYAERKKICPEVFSELKHHHYGKMSVRMCELAAIGHPNIEGARVTAESIKTKLYPLFTSTSARAN